MVYFAQAVQLSLLVYIIDLFIVVCCLDSDNDDDDDDNNNNNIDNNVAVDISFLCAKILYTLYAANVCAKVKHYLLIKYIGEMKKKDGLALLINHLANAMIGGVAAMIIIDILELSGLGIRSAFALGSAGTLAITLGTQTLVSHVVSGFTMTTSNRFYVGDFVKFGNGSNAFSGTVVSMVSVEVELLR
jgi:small-conductance mechanosensitive channel